MKARSRRSLLWPSSRFYWGLVDVSTLPRRTRRSPEAHGYLFETLVPQPLEELQLAFAELSGARILVCAVPRAALEGLPADTVLVAPSELPDFLRDELHEALDPRELNVLTGPYAPAVVRTLERRTRRITVASLIAFLLVLALGFERRARAAWDRVEVDAAREREIYAGLLGGGADESSLPSELQVEAELRSLRRTRAADLPIAVPADAALSLQALLEAWPDELAIETESIHVTETAMHVRARIPTMGASQELADSLGDVPGWRLLQPAIHALGGGVQATLQLERTEGGAR